MSLFDLDCCFFWILFFILLAVAFIRSRKKKAVAQEETPVVRKSPEEHLLLGKQNIQLGNRQAVVKDFLQVYRHGRAVLREQAVRALEGMDEVETF